MPDPFFADIVAVFPGNAWQTNVVNNSVTNKCEYFKYNYILVYKFLPINIYKYTVINK